MELFWKPVWILLYICLVFWPGHDASGQDTTEQAPGDIQTAAPATLPNTEASAGVNGDLTVSQPDGDKDLQTGADPSPTVNSEQEESVERQMVSKQSLVTGDDLKNLFPPKNAQIHPQTSVDDGVEVTLAAEKVTSAENVAADETQKEVVASTEAQAETTTLADESTQKTYVAIETTQTPDVAAGTTAGIADNAGASNEPTTEKEQEFMTTQKTDKEATTQSDDVITTQHLPQIETTEDKNKPLAAAVTTERDATSEDTGTTEYEVQEERKVETTQQDTVETTTALADTDTSDDPCYNHMLLDEAWRHLSNGGGNHNDRHMTEGWYAYKYRGDWAAIPSIPIKKNHCGGEYPYRLDLQQQALPDFNRTIKAVLCTTIIAGGVPVNCLHQAPVTVKGCDGYLIYHHSGPKGDGVICTHVPGENIPYNALFDPPETPPPQKVVTQPPPTPKSPQKLTDEEKANIVTVELSIINGTWDDESLALQQKLSLDIETFLKIIEELRRSTTEIPSDDITEETTDTGVTSKVHIPHAELTESPPDVAETDSAQEVTVRQAADHVTQADDSDAASVTVGGALHVTVSGANSIGEQPGDDTMESNEAAGLRSTGADATNRGGSENPADAVEPSYRKRRQAEQDSPSEGITYVEPTPRVQDGKLQISFFVQDKDGNVIPAAEVLRALKTMKERGEPIFDDPKVKIENMYEGIAKEASAVKADRQTIWEAHKGLWITLAVMFGLCLLIVLFCLICLTCCRKEEYTPTEKSPLREAEEGSRHPHAVENPIADDVITREEAPMVERENPAFTSNGGGQHLTKDEDNGYIVPLHELNEDEKFKTDVENTKL